MAVAVLAWGSLVWKPGILKIADDWSVDGPRLPIEFSRISRDGRLTLVIDSANGVGVQTRFAVSALHHIEQVIENLRQREQTTKTNIGFVDRVRKTHHLAPALFVCGIEMIHDWAARLGLDAVVWTGLGSNFAERRGEPYSVEAALRYVGTLEGNARKSCLDYIRNSPPEVRTPFRFEFEKHCGKMDN